MQTLTPPVQESQAQTQTIAVAASFTAEPLEDALNFWMQELGIPAQVEFAPYNQIFQQLLDPTSLLAQNQRGVNVILLRFEDWRRDSTGSIAEIAEKADRNLEDLLTALKAAPSATPRLVCLCPDSPSAQADPDWQVLSQRLEAEMVAELSKVSGLYLVRSPDFAAYPVADHYDAQRDKLGHIPFTPVFFTALSTVLARKIYTLKAAPHKVIVLDCDNTIWQGVVGEDGATGIEITPAYVALQNFMLAQQSTGIVLCLCSKNNEPDVLEAFEQRPEMPLKLENIVAWRINWLPKSENIKSLAQELNLGLDSFIFIDDNPVECAEVQASCPEVLTLQLPIDGDILHFLNHVWAFDHLKVTEEDKQRTTLYKQNLERDRFLKEAPTITDFLAGLELVVDIAEPAADQLPRVAQLTQRTNQFNFTTIRRSESEIQQLGASGLECRRVEVRDRFGDYGLVGVMIFGTDAETLTIDSFLLSCRVLGRGVEHRMLTHLAEIAQERQLLQIKAAFLRTKKNLPALNFLERVLADFQQPIDNGFEFIVPVEFATALSYKPGEAEPEQVSDTPAKAIATVAAPQAEKSQRFGRIAKELYDPAEILQQIHQSQQRSSRPDLEQDYVAPLTTTETQLATLWEELLQLDRVGVQDNYFDLGGTSLLSVELVTKIEQVFGQKLPLTAIVEAPTIAQLAARLTQPSTQDSLVLIRTGGSKLPVFLVHDGDGETLLYRNLAYRLKPEHPVYGLQPYSKDGFALLHSRITDMADYHITKMRSVQPQGPYLLGGMCAGGLIAFEIAHRLQQQGESVGMVAIIDAADVAAPKRVGRIAEQRLKRFFSTLGEEQSQSWLTKLGYILTKARQKLINVVTYEISSRLKTWQHRSQMRQLQRALDAGNLPPTSLRNLSVRTIYLFAESEYVPTDLYPGEVALFRATAGEGTDEPYVNIYSDPLLGWGQRVTQTVRVYDIPGGHSSMLQEPNVAAMAEAMQTYIDEALSNPRSYVPAAKATSIPD